MTKGQRLADCEIGDYPSRVSVDGGGDLLSQSLQLVGGHLHVMREVEVAGLVEWHEVDVGMRHIDTYHGFADLDAGADLLEPFGDTLGKEMEFTEEVVVEVEDVVDFLFRDAEDVTTDDGVDVEESETTVGLGNTVAGDFACDDFAEYGSHIIVRFS